VEIKRKEGEDVEVRNEKNGMQKKKEKRRQELAEKRKDKNIGKGQ
jgi:hypothetical protein